MLSTIEAPSLETKAELWKVRARGKQKWLEQALAEPPASPQEAARRLAWIKRALRVIKRAQAAIEYRTRLVDAYAQHLNALEMTLMSQVEEKTSPRTGESERRKPLSLIFQRIPFLYKTWYWGIAPMPFQ